MLHTDPAWTSVIHLELVDRHLMLGSTMEMLQMMLEETQKKNSRIWESQLSVLSFLLTAEFEGRVYFTECDGVLAVHVLCLMHASGSSKGSQLRILTRRLAAPTGISHNSVHYTYIWQEEQLCPYYIQSVQELVKQDTARRAFCEQICHNQRRLYVYSKCFVHGQIAYHCP